MNDILKDELCKYLGELMYEKDSEFDLILKDKIILKINAVKVLLEIPVGKTNGSKMYQMAKRFVAKSD
jgi:hypothetical protein